MESTNRHGLAAFSHDRSEGHGGQWRPPGRQAGSDGGGDPGKRSSRPCRPARSCSQLLRARLKMVRFPGFCLGNHSYCIVQYQPTLLEVCHAVGSEPRLLAYLSIWSARYPPPTPFLPEFSPIVVCFLALSSPLLTCWETKKKRNESYDEVSRAIGTPATLCVRPCWRIRVIHRERNRPFWRSEHTGLGTPRRSSPCLYRRRLTRHSRHELPAGLDLALRSLTSLRRTVDR